MLEQGEHGFEGLRQKCNDEMVALSMSLEHIDAS